ncbi:hypothetical protein SZ63_09825 [Methanoculleus sediminis]|uniref:Uncharacterized protein n=1 Tax=Methanoculleus sediminis TaxID=1550566 RepID=A0A0H1QY99_9EURY|nr:hypothetical protein [Methanoculleus sediminis]KLK87591.1 hypothetical protein SZ63_09825 [Methanoculleus sediminis]
MDSTGTIQFFLILLTIMTVVGFAGITYYLAEISRAIKRQASPEASVTPEASPGPDIAAPVSTPPLKAIDPASTGSLEETLGAISEKYSLASLTLAAADGLLIGSTKPGSEDEAARYSHLYSEGRLHDEEGVELLGVPYRGETVVGIAHPSEHLSDEQMNALEQDIRETLQHWV